MTIQNIFISLDNLKNKEEIKEVINKPHALLIYNINFKLNIDELKNFKKYILPINNDFTFILEEHEINNNDQIDEIINDNQGDTLDCRLLIEYTLESPIFHFYSEEGYLCFLKHFMKSSISPLLNKKDKIRILIHNLSEPLANSSIFNYEENEEELDSTTKKSIQILNKKNLPIGLIPNCLPQDIFKSIPKTDLISALLSSISNDHTDNKYYFKGHYNKTIYFDTNTYKCIEQHFSDLFELYEYLYYYDVSTDQKKTFARKAICNNLKFDEIININKLPRSYFKDIKDETEYLYSVFEDGEISVFLTEKKEIIKEYSDLSKDILQSINQIKMAFNNNLRTIITILIINLGLKFIPTTNQLISKSILIMAILYLFINILILAISDYSTFQNMRSKQDILQNQFAFLSNKILNLKNQLNSVAKKEFSNYESSLALAGCTYIIALIILIILYIIT